MHCGDLAVDPGSLGKGVRNPQMAEITNPIYVGFKARNFFPKGWFHSPMVFMAHVGSAVLFEALWPGVVLAWRPHPWMQQRLASC